MAAVFALSGEEGTLPVAELSAVLRTYDATPELRALTSRLYLVDTDADPVRIAARAAHVRVGARVLGWVRRTASSPRLGAVLDGLPNPGTFCVRTLGPMDSERPEQLIEWLAHGVHESWPDVRVDLDEAGLTLYVYPFRQRVLVAAGPPATRRGWATRRPRIRPFFHPTALYPKFARTLVNLTQVPEGGLLLDPFCGTGSILLEAASIGATPVGIDRARRMCLGTLTNLRFFGLQSSLGVVQADARMPPVRRAQAIATDTPYGREASTWGASPEELVRRVLEYTLDILAPGGRAVVTHSLPQVEVPAGLRLAERHIQPVHRSLTRRTDVYLRA